MFSLLGISIASFAHLHWFRHVEYRKRRQMVQSTNVDVSCGVDWLRVWTVLANIRVNVHADTRQGHCLLGNKTMTKCLTAWTFGIQSKPRHSATFECIEPLLEQHLSIPDSFPSTPAESSGVSSEHAVAIFNNQYSTCLFTFTWSVHGQNPLRLAFLFIYRIHHLQRNSLCIRRRWHFCSGRALQGYCLPLHHSLIIIAPRGGW